MRMSTKTFHSLRYFVQIVLPAVAVFLTTIGGTWNIEVSVQIGTTISAVITLLSGVLGASSAIYDKERGYEYGEDLGVGDTDCTYDMFSNVHISNRSVREQG